MGRHAGERARIGGARLGRAVGVGLVVVLAFTSLDAVGASAAPRRFAKCAALGVGAKGPAVATIQRVVRTTPDGDYGPLTRAAVRRWQRRHHLRHTGVVNAATWRSLPAWAARVACSRPVRGTVDASGRLRGVKPTCSRITVGSVGPVVRALQAKVHARPDGVFGPRTLRALHRAQRRVKVRRTRRVYPGTWAAFGLTGTPACFTRPAPVTTPTSSIGASGASPSPTPTPVAAQKKAPADAAEQAVIRALSTKLAATLPAAPGTTTDPVTLKMLGFAKRQTGKPYKWGAAGPRAYDCSGLVLASYRAAGLTLPRVAADQYDAGPTVPLDQAQQGDLVFYASDVAKPETIYHVAIYAGSGQVLDAPHTGAYVGTRALWTRDLLPVAVRPAAQLQLPVGPGSTGWTVSQLQAALDRGGASLAVDGADGPLTTAAVQAWQAAHGLPANGVVDVTTWLTLH